MRRICRRNMCPIMALGCVASRRRPRPWPGLQRVPGSSCLVGVLEGKPRLLCRLLGPNGAGKSTSINMVRPCDCPCRAVPATSSLTPRRAVTIPGWLVCDEPVPQRGAALPVTCSNGITTTGTCR